MTILHIVRAMEEALPLEVAQAQHRQGHQVALLLLHDAVLRQPAFPGRVVACREDLVARGVEGRHPAVSYQEIIQLIFEHDKVISW